MSLITLKGIIDEDFVNYKVPSMTIMFPRCDFKCEQDEESFCHNSPLTHEKDIRISPYSLCKRYMENPISEAIVFQGLEPFDSYEDLLVLIYTIRHEFLCNDDIVIYTGYNKDEIELELIELSKFANIVVKFGRYITGQAPHVDEVLGVSLSSNNQFGERIS